MPFSSDPFWTLVISGHGTREGRIWASGSRIDSTKRPQTTKRIRNKLDPRCIVTMAGCDVGLNAPAVQRVADMLGVPVRAPFGRLKPGNMPKHYLEVTPGGKPPPIRIDIIKK